MSWAVESLQFVLFHSPEETFDAYQIWLKVFEASPDGYQKHPEPSLRTTVANGLFAGFTFQIQCGIGRIDVIVSQNIGDEPFARIVQDEVALNLLRERVDRVALDIQSFRLALVAQLYEHLKSIPQASRRFGELTQQRAPANATDLSYGLNVRKQYTENGFVVNRLCRWSALTKQVVQMQVTNGVPGPLPPIEQPAVVLNMDINTVVRSTPFKSQLIPTIIDCLFAEYRQLKEDGYAELVR